MLTTLVPISLFGLLVGYIVFLILECILHKRRLHSIPTRITVTGTRGKTSVTRILASIMRESGKTVLAKTTGTEARLIMPDGSEKSFRGSKPANIIEQKRLVKKAAKLKSDFLITEIMSIKPENHKTETFKLLQPQYTILTNTYPDHLDAVEEGEMSKLYCNDIFPGSTVVAHQEELDTVLLDTIETRNCELISLRGASSPLGNIDLAKNAAGLFCKHDETIKKGIESYRMDSGETRAYKVTLEGREVIFISLFAANDPTSSRSVISKITDNPFYKNYNSIALLSMRADRPERSVQWRDFLKSGGSDLFDELFYLGSHRHYMKRSLKKGRVINKSKPDRICDNIFDNSGDNCLVIGLMNIGGIGLKLSEYWANIGKEIEIQVS